jgi:hypothetical protein
MVGPGRSRVWDDSVTIERIDLNLAYFVKTAIAIVFASCVAKLVRREKNIKFSFSSRSGLVGGFLCWDVARHSCTESKLTLRLILYTASLS